MSPRRGEYARGVNLLKGVYVIAELTPACGAPTAVLVSLSV